MGGNLARRIDGKTTDIAIRFLTGNGSATALLTGAVGNVEILKFKGKFAEAELGDVCAIDDCLQLVGPPSRRVLSWVSVPELSISSNQVLAAGSTIRPA